MSKDDLTSEQFRRACGLWASGVSIVTTADADGIPYGLTMNAVTSLSLDPPMFLVCVDLGSDTLAPMTGSRCYCINVLTARQQELSNRFAKKGEDKFDGVAWQAGSTGAPVIGDTLISIECSVSDILDGGDHKIMCGLVEAIHSNDSVDVEPLLYYGGRYAALKT